MIIIPTFLGTIITNNVQIFPMMRNLQGRIREGKKNDCLMAIQELRKKKFHSWHEQHNICFSNT
jgi:hypothetical protein